MLPIKKESVGMKKLIVNAADYKAGLYELIGISDYEQPVSLGKFSTMVELVHFIEKNVEILISHSKLIVKSDDYKRINLEVLIADIRKWYRV
jgi:hypothetical protein